MFRAQAFLAVLLCSCGGAVATEDLADATPPRDASARFDAGGVMFVDAAALPPPIKPVPIDVGQWVDVGPNDSCGFEVSEPTRASVSGDKVIAFKSGNEIPVVIFGCSGLVLGKRYSMLASDVPDTNDAQWALLDLGDATYFVANSQVWSSCSLSVTVPNLLVGAPASGSFSCAAMPGATDATATVVKGHFATALVAAVPFTLPN